MTQEEPKRPKTTPLFCDECNAAVRLERKSNQLLILRCACDKRRSIKVAAALPEGWSA